MYVDKVYLCIKPMYLMLEGVCGCSYVNHVALEKTVHVSFNLLHFKLRLVNMFS